MLMPATAPAQIGPEDIFGEILRRIPDPNRDHRRPGPHRPRPPRGGHITCTASDNGWEEHWGGHGSCHECLSKHGDCTETCSANYFQCTAVGINHRGEEERMMGRDQDQYYAEDMALDRCYRYLRHCRVENCVRDQETISRRSCR